MAKRRRSKSRKKPQQKVAIATIAGLAAGLFGPAESLAAGNPSVAFARFAKAYTGYNPVDKTFRLTDMKEGLLPLAVGVGVSMIASKAGVNRRLKLPFVKL